MSIKIVLGAALAIAVGAGALALRLDRGDGGPPASEPSPAAAPAPRARAHVEAPRLATIAAPAPGVAPAPSVAPAPPATGPRELSAAEARERHQRLFDHGEPATPWSRAAVQRARERLPAALPPGSEVVGVECRGRLCRLESNHRDLGSYEQYVEAVFFRVETQLWNAGFYAYLDDPAPGGERRAVAFLAADGEDLPPP